MVFPIRKITRCKNCDLCAVAYGCGFTSREQYFCTEHRRYVDTTDGCSFGYTGKPRSAILEACDAHIAGFKPSLQPDYDW